MTRGLFFWGVAFSRKNLLNNLEIYDIISSQHKLNIIANYKHVFLFGKNAGLYFRVLVGMR